MVAVPRPRLGIDRLEAVLHRSHGIRISRRHEYRTRGLAVLPELLRRGLYSQLQERICGRSELPQAIPACLARRTGKKTNAGITSYLSRPPFPIAENGEIFADYGLDTHCGLHYTCPLNKEGPMRSWPSERSFGFGLLTLLFPCVALAQIHSGTISGTVMDSSGGV